MNNILSPKITHIEDEIAQLQTVMNNKKSQIHTIQSLFLQASLALNAIQEASRHIPVKFRPHVEQQVWNILQLTKSPSPKETQGKHVNKKKAKPSPQGFQSDTKSKKKKHSKTKNTNSQKKTPKAKQPVSTASFQSIRKPTETQNLAPQKAKAQTNIDSVDCLWKASQNILGFLSERKQIANKQLQVIMTEAYGGNDAQGYWQWKDAYEALEVALVQYLKKQPNITLEDILALEMRYPTHTRRSEESLELQQFSTPLPLGYIVAQAAMLKDDDIVLESSAGNGFLAVWAEKQGAKLILNEIAESRRASLAKLFPHAPLFNHNGESIHDTLKYDLKPTVALLNPPFCTSPNIKKRHAEATFNHIYSALQRLPQGGRLVAISANWFAPYNQKWQKAFAQIEKLGKVVFSVGIDGHLYRKQGTNMDTRLTVIDKGITAHNFYITTKCCQDAHELLTLIENRLQPRYEGKTQLPVAKKGNEEDTSSNNGIEVAVNDNQDIQKTPPKPVDKELLKDVFSKQRIAPSTKIGDDIKEDAEENRGKNNEIETLVLPSSFSNSSPVGDDIKEDKTINPLSIDTPLTKKVTPKEHGAIAKTHSEKPKQKPLLLSLSDNINHKNPVKLHYNPKTEDNAQLSDELYQAYQPQTINIKGAKPHPTSLVQSAAMASVIPPKPTYQPLLPKQIIENSLLSAPQLESIIYAGEAHSQYLSGHYLIDGTLEKIHLTHADNEEAVQYRRGWLLGDGTGTGKGRQAAGIILDNWLKGKKKALWISKSDKLIEDARRDWIALGGNKEDIIALKSIKSGASLDIEQGILFATYALLRMPGKQGKISRIEQLIQWLEPDFDGVIIFDECHAMGNAMASKGKRGTKKPSQQGLAGLKLQYALPHARVVYVSATGATKVINLAYAVRLGLWQTQDFPFAHQKDFISSVEQGGLAAMEVVSRDLKSLGLYASRSLSYQGVEYDILEHELTEEQIKIYDEYAHAYQIIHENIQEALKATKIVSLSGKIHNKRAKSSARSVFESCKQRFFNHLLTAMKMPTLLKAISHDIEQGNAVIIQIVSTNEALLERRLAQIPSSEWGDLNIDITPREYILDYLRHAFPVQLHQTYSDEEGNLYSKPLFDDDGNPVLSQQALQQRDELIESLASMTPIPGALDQIIHHFGHEKVAEVTGRSKRIIKDTKDGRDVLKVSHRPSSANLGEVQAFMDDEKPILIFSEAGGTGASYHADLTRKNQRQRIHYLLEAGWRADNAIQGLGRSHRSYQKQPPIFRPVTSNVKGEKRFLSTIAKRLDSLGALTKGQRETGSQGIFREEDNLESLYARTALNQLYYSLYHGQLSFCSLELFETSTGLGLQASDGCYLKQDLPPMNQFLNRLLALPISLQNQLFEAFEMRLEQNIENAKNAGTYELGVETLKAHSLQIVNSQIVYTHSTGGETRCYEILKKEKAKIMGLKEALALVKAHKGRFLHNTRSGKVCLEIPTNSILEEDGGVTLRVNLIRPNSNEKIRQPQMEKSHWQTIDEETFARLWQEEMKTIHPYMESRFYLMTGLLLPIWNRLNTLNMRVWRMQTDDGQNLLGRMIPVEQIEQVYKNLGLDAPPLSPTEVYNSVYEHKKVMKLGRWELKNVTISNQSRLEVIGFQSKSESDLLKTFGCHSEIIQWRLRLFIPVNDNAIPIIEKIMDAA